MRGMRDERIKVTKVLKAIRVLAMMSILKVMRVTIMITIMRKKQKMLQKVNFSLNHIPLYFNKNLLFVRTF